MIDTKAIFELGIRPDHSDYLQRKIKMSNQISFIFLIYLLLLDVVFLALNVIDILYLSISLTVLYFLPLVLSFLQFPLLARFIIAILPSFAILFSHAAITNEGEAPFSSILLLQFSAVLIPWILFDMKEKVILFVALSLSGSTLFLFPFFNELVSLRFDNQVLKTNLFDAFIVLSSILIVYIILFILQNDTLLKESSNTNLIKEMQSQQMQLQTKEHKLSEYIKEVEKAQADDKRRQWRGDGIAKFYEIIRRQSQDSQKLYEEIIGEMVKIVEANQGGLFLLNAQDDDEPFLELVACYAYERSKYIDKRIYVSEGLLGQAYQDKEQLLLTEVPPKYVHITSGLGKALPRCILISPLMYNEQICGMIELASFQVFEPHHIEFVRRVGEIIASAIMTAQNNEKTQLLLRETQAQSEQMRAQEEEMRQNLEELHATQEEMERKQKEIEATNQKMIANEAILKKMVEKLKEKEQEMTRVLGETQQKNEELQAQEEEMRQNLEELQATQEEMKRKQQEAETANAQLKASQKEMLKKQTEIEQMNKNMLTNQAILQKALEKSKKLEKELQEKNEKFKANEAQIVENLGKIDTVKEEMYAKEQQYQDKIKKLEEELLLKTNLLNKKT
jgi:GAF domain-containing protein